MAAAAARASPDDLGGAGCSSFIANESPEDLEVYIYIYICVCVCECVEIDTDI